MILKTIQLRLGDETDAMRTKPKKSFIDDEEGTKKIHFFFAKAPLKHFQMRLPLQIRVMQ